MVMQIAARGQADTERAMLGRASPGIACAVPTRPAHPAGRAETASPAVRAIRGESGAFAELYDLHVDRVFRFACFRLGDAEAAADLTHDVFVSALRSIGELRDPDRFDVWLMRIAHHRVLNHWRGLSNRLSTDSLEGAWDDDAHDIDETERCAALGNDPREDWDRRLDVDALVAGTVRLSDAGRQVLGLRFVAGLSLAETATVIERSEDAVKKLQRRALRALRLAATAEVRR